MAGPRPFFCQLESVEMIIWLTEVAPGRVSSKGLLNQIAKANEEANPELFRLAMKMATGSGETTVMAMLITWQAVSAAPKESKDFSRAFLIVAPGITIKDGLRVLQPSEPDNYYETREIAPPEVVLDIRRAEIVITNCTFQYRETLAPSKVTRSFPTTEADADVLKPAWGKLLRYDRANVLNDEAHHCYRHKISANGESALTGDDKKAAAENEESARLWINGIEVLDRKLSKGVRVAYDLSASQFFLRRSGYQQSTLFSWIVSDFNLMDAIEGGLVKLPRVPVSDNLVQTDTVVYRTTAPMRVAKGLKSRAVVVMACDERFLPLDERVADDVVELDDIYDIYDIYEIDRRLHYVACTRARDHPGVVPTSEYLADFTSGAS